MANDKKEKKPCEHSLLRPSGRFYDVPGQKIDGAESCDCINCRTSKSLRIRLFKFPQLKKNKPT